MKLRGLKEWIPALALTIIVVVIAGFCAATNDSSAPKAIPTVVVAAPTPVPYEPVTARPIQFLTSGPYHVGQMITIIDGICNTTDETLQGVTIIGFEEQERDRISSRNIVVRPPIDASAAVSPLPRPIAPGCVGLDPINGPLPAELPPGKWRLYINLTVMGPQANQVQRINDLSPTFEVIP